MTGATTPVVECRAHRACCATTSRRPASRSTASPSGSGPSPPRRCTASRRCRRCSRRTAPTTRAPSLVRLAHPRSPRRRPPRSRPPCRPSASTGRGALGLVVDDPRGDVRRDVRPAALCRRRPRVVGGVRPLRGRRPGRRCVPTTCSASAARRRRWRRGRSADRSTAPSTSAPAAACRPCTSRRTATPSSRPTSPSGRLRMPRFTACARRPAARPAPWRPARSRCGRDVLARREQPALRHHAAHRRRAALRVSRRRPRGDAVVRSLVRQVGTVLEPGGVAQFLGNWEVPAGRTWRDVWVEWLDEQAREGVALDAWVVQRESQDPAEYAELWSRDGGQLPGSGRARPDVCRVAGRLRRPATSQSVGFGVVTLQRPATDRPTWRSLDEAAGPVAAPMGPVGRRRARAPARGSPSTPTTRCSTSRGRAPPTSPRSVTDAPAPTTRASSSCARAAGCGGSCGPGRCWRHTSAWPTAS